MGVQKSVVKYGLLVALVVSLLASAVQAQEQDPLTMFVEDEYFKGKVVDVLREGEQTVGGFAQQFQIVEVELFDGQQPGEVVEIKHGGDYALRNDQLVTEGDNVVVIKTVQLGEVGYHIFDRYRLPNIAVMGIAFFALVVAVARRQGAGAIVGLAISLGVITYFIIPQIIAGNNPVFISTIGAAIIAVVSITIAHGWYHRTAVALVSTLVTLGVAVGLSMVFVSLAHLSGVGSDEAFYLQVGPLADIDLRGLLLGAIIIGTLGVLDDVTTSQVAAVEELRRANSKLNAKELYMRGLSVGREHIAALVNTLALAYAGAAFPLFLIVAAFPSQPLWVTLNGELVMEEIIRTLAGSTALVIAVPLSTLLAAYIFGTGRRQ